MSEFDFLVLLSPVTVTKPIIILRFITVLVDNWLILIDRHTFYVLILYF